METLALRGVDALKSAKVRYGDARVIRTQHQWIRVKDRRVESVTQSEDLGLGIRALCGPAWGFASCPDPKPLEVDRTAKEALRIAQAGRVAMKGTLLWADEPPHVDTWQTPFIKDPFKIPLDRKIDLLLAITTSMLKVKGIKMAQAGIGCRLEEKVFANTEGSLITTRILMMWAEYTATAVGHGDKRTRSFCATPRSAGYEHIEATPLLQNATRVAEEAVAQLTAKTCPVGVMDLVLDPENLALTMHESVGHPTELDRVLGWEANYAGTSFATPEKLGRFRYGAPLIHFLGDNTILGGLSTTGYDDDGVACQKWDIVKDGILTGYTTTRETAPFIQQSRSRGSSRGDGWFNTPITRIPNLYLAPGEENLSPEELIADTRHGIYIEGQGTFSIDQRRENFQFGGDAFWLIKNGKKAGMLKDVIYQSTTPAFWGSCDALCDERDWQLHGVLNCGKGQPPQTGRMSHGASTSRFRKIRVGGAKA